MKIDINKVIVDEGQEVRLHFVEPETGDELHFVFTHEGLIIDLLMDGEADDVRTAGKTYDELADEIFTYSPSSAPAGHEEEE